MRTRPLQADPNSRYSPKRALGRRAVAISSSYHPLLDKLDARKPDKLAPFIRFIFGELAETRRRARKIRAAHIGKSRLDPEPSPRVTGCRP
jgi:hypothetical protein